MSKLKLEPPKDLDDYLMPEVFSIPIPETGTTGKLLKQIKTGSEAIGKLAQLIADECGEDITEELHARPMAKHAWVSLGDDASMSFERDGTIFVNTGGYTIMSSSFGALRTVEYDDVPNEAIDEKPPWKD